MNISLFLLLSTIIGNKHSCKKLKWLPTRFAYYCSLHTWWVTWCTLCTCTLELLHRLYKHRYVYDMHDFIVTGRRITGRIVDDSGPWLAGRRQQVQLPAAQVQYEDQLGSSCLSSCSTTTTSASSSSIWLLLLIPQIRQDSTIDPILKYVTNHACAAARRVQRKATTSSDPGQQHQDYFDH